MQYTPKSKLAVMFFYNAPFAIKLDPVTQVEASAAYLYVGNFYKKCRQQMVKLTPTANCASTFAKAEAITTPKQTPPKS